MSKQKTFGRSVPSYAYELQMRKELQGLIKEMQQETEKEVIAFYKSEMAFDAEGRAQVMSKLREEWYKRFERIGKQMSKWLAEKADERTYTQITRKLKQIGWSINPQYTDQQQEKIKALAADSVDYIKSIPQKYLRNVQHHVAESVKRGGDRATLTKELARLYTNLGKDSEKALDYAALVARDQSNKMTQGYAVINAQALGATEGRWIHVQGVKSSRETHIKFDGQTFPLTDGLYDEDVGELVLPGELPYCNCQFEVLLPGFNE